MIIEIKNSSDIEKIVNFLIENEIDYEEDTYIWDFFFRQKIEHCFHNELEILDDVDNEMLKEIMQETLDNNIDDIIESTKSRLDCNESLERQINETVLEDTIYCARKLLKDEKDNIRKEMFKMVEEDIYNTLEYI